MRSALLFAVLRRRAIEIDDQRLADFPQPALRRVVCVRVAHVLHRHHSIQIPTTADHLLGLVLLLRLLRLPPSTELGT